MKKILALLITVFSLPAIAQINNRTPLDIALKKFCDSTTYGLDYSKRKAKKTIYNCYTKIDSNLKPIFMDITIGSDGVNLIYGPCSAMDGYSIISDKEGNILGITAVNHYCGPDLAGIKLNLDGKTPLSSLYFETSGDPNRIKDFHLY